MLDYQDSLLKGHGRKGIRDCEARWKLIKPYVPSRGMVLDVGSNLAYFGLQAVSTYKDIAVVSIESDPRIMALQQRILASYQTTRVCAVQGQMNAALSGAWVKVCDWFDLTLLLSIVHWFDEPAKVIYNLAQMSSRMIVEIPDHRDAGACGQFNIKLWRSDPVQWLQETTQRQSALIGRIERHTSEFPAHIILVEGPVSRIPVMPYWDYRYQHPQGNDYQFDFDGKQMHFAIRNRTANYIPGINMVSLMKLGKLIWPTPKTFIKQGIAKIKRSSDHPDPLPHNMLWTANGLQFIDNDDDLGWGHPPGVAISMFKRKIRDWQRNRLVHENAYVPSLPWWRLIIWRWPRVIAHRILPKPLFHYLKTKFSF